MDYGTITPTELAKRLESESDLKLIDVREPEEHALAQLEQAELRPLSQFNQWVATLSPNQEIIFMCHHGIRSAQVCQYLAQSGFAKLQNLAGGIDAWSCEVDHHVPRY